MLAKNNQIGQSVILNSSPLRQFFLFVAFLPTLYKSSAKAGFSETPIIYDGTVTPKAVGISRPVLGEIMT